MNGDLEKIDVVILCGGVGRRLQSVVGDRPKVLAEINGRAFLEILIHRLLHFGFKRIILGVGYQKHKIISYFMDKTERKGYELIFSEEETSLGTGGALKKVRPLIKSDTFLAMNGDSFCEVDFNKLLDFHVKKKSLLTMVLTLSSMAQDFGFVRLDRSCRIEGFEEKVALGGKEALVNAGIYFMEKNIFDKMPKKTVFSLEYDFFTTIEKNACYGYLAEGKFLDIGTPERYRETKSWII